MRLTELHSSGVYTTRHTIILQRDHDNLVPTLNEAERRDSNYFLYHHVLCSMVPYLFLLPWYIPIYETKRRDDAVAIHFQTLCERQ